MSLRETLTAETERRQAEVDAYQFNIDNYTMAMANLENDDSEDAVAFRQQLQTTLKTERREQLKSQTMLTVLQQRLAALPPE